MLSRSSIILLTATIISSIVLAQTLFTLSIPMTVSTPDAALSLELRQEDGITIISDYPWGELGRGDSAIMYSGKVRLYNTGEATETVSYTTDVPTGFTLKIEKWDTSTNHIPWTGGNIAVGSYVELWIQLKNDAAAYGLSFNVTINFEVT